jgi:DNA-binding NarL/FixJ family response regulator
VTIRLLIVDPHPLVRWAVAKMAESEAGADIEVVGEASTAAEAMQLAKALRPDVVTIDVALADRSGLELVEELRESHCAVGTVVLSADARDDVLFKALEAGASAFVDKCSPLQEIMAAIRHAHVAAASFSSTGLAAALRRRRDVSSRIELSPRERQVLELLQAGYSVPEVAARLYVSLSTAKTYVSRLYEKLGATNRAQALMAAFRLGLMAREQSLTG